MLIVTAKRIAETKAGKRTYEVWVRINDQVLWKGKVSGHDPTKGWKALVKEVGAVINKCEDIRLVEICPDHKCRGSSSGRARDL